jgi:hypothetical protein
MNKIIFPVALLLFASSVFASGGISPAQLKFKDWGSSRPVVAVVFSDPFSSRFVTRKHFLYRWVDASRQVVEPQSRIICDIVFPGEPRRCSELWAKYPTFVAHELYLGPASGFVPSRTSSPSSVGVNDLHAIPLNPTKVLLLDITTGKAATQQVFVAAYDDISDDDLRQMALEYGFYPALSWTIE